MSKTWDEKTAEEKLASLHSLRRDVVAQMRREGSRSNCGAYLKKLDRQIAHEYTKAQRSLSE
jgi:hypothetical protein